MYKRQANEVSDISLELFSAKKLEKSDEEIQKALKSLRNADIVFLYRSSETCWETLESEIKLWNNKKPVISTGHDPSSWLQSTVKPDIVATCFLYIDVYKRQHQAAIFRRKPDLFILPKWI